MGGSSSSISIDTFRPSGLEQPQQDVLTDRMLPASAGDSESGAAKANHGTPQGDMQTLLAAHDGIDTGRFLQAQLQNVPTSIPSTLDDTASLNAPSGQILQHGMRGAEVERLQTQMVKLGYLSDAEKATGPGIFGRKTARAVAAFQRDNNLAAYGAYDHATQAAMGDVMRGVQYGSRGNAVHGLQQRLVELGLMTKDQVATGAGTFGPQTRRALHAFQRQHGLEAAGSLTLKTYQALREASSVSASSNTGTGGNRALAETAQAAITDSRYEEKGGRCSRFANQVVEQTYYGTPSLAANTYHGGVLTKFFDHHKGDKQRTPNAADTARHFVKDGRYVVSDYKPGSEPHIGDLLFKTNGSNGHVGIYIGNGRVAENSSVQPKRRGQGQKGIRSLEDFGHVDVVVRLPAPGTSSTRGQVKNQGTEQTTRTERSTATSGVGQPEGKTFIARGTGYYPANTRMEGGLNDRQGRNLHTLQDYMAGRAPYVSVAMDATVFRYGTRLRIPELEQKYGRIIEFRVVDTGDAFKHQGTSRIDICTADRSASLDPTINGNLHLVVEN